MTDKLEKAKRVIDIYYNAAKRGIFTCKGWSGDDMDTIYSSDEITIDICYRYEYFEVFGLSRDEFEELKEYYYNKE